jgi:hypothetical protein
MAAFLLSAFSDIRSFFKEWWGDDDKGVESETRPLYEVRFRAVAG